LRVTVTAAIVLLKTIRGGGTDRVWLAVDDTTFDSAWVWDPQNVFHVKRVTTTTRMVITIMVPGEVKSQWPESNRSFSVAICLKSSWVLNSPEILVQRSLMAAVVVSSFGFFNRSPSDQVQWSQLEWISTQIHQL